MKEKIVMVKLKNLQNNNFVVLSFTIFASLLLFFIIVFNIFSYFDSAVRYGQKSVFYVENVSKNKTKTQSINYIEKLQKNIIKTYF